MGVVTCTDACQIPNDCVPPAEVCNGLDDDCQNGPDDTFPCAQGAVLPCTTTCGSAGQKTCTASCEIPETCDPPVETCNGADDDCDGLADDGLALFGQPFALGGTDARRPVIAYSGSIYAVAYADLGSTPWKLMLQRFDASGAKLGAAIEVDGSTAGPGAVAWNGSVFGVIWGDTYNGDGVYFRAYSEAGAALSSVVKLRTSNAQSGIGLAVSGTSFLAAFDDFKGQSGSLFTILSVSGTGQVLGSYDPTPPSARVLSPRIVPSGAGFKLFWSDNRSGKYAIFARDLDASGAPSGPEVATTDGTSDAELWSAVNTGQGYVVGYSRFDTNAASLLLPTDAAGTPTGPEVKVGTMLQFPELQWTGSRLAVLNGDAFQIRDAQLAPVTVAHPFYTPTTNNIRYSNLLWAGGRFFGIAGTDGGSTDAPVARIFGSWGCNAP
ncbi:RTX toxin [Minicystis rosea]|nr:RTX toxin [Minicystis rosea]